MDYARCTTDPCAPRTRDLQAPRCDYPANVNAHGHGVNVVSSKSAATPSPTIMCRSKTARTRMVASPHHLATRHRPVIYHDHYNGSLEIYTGVPWRPRIGSGVGSWQTSP